MSPSSAMTCEVVGEWWLAAPTEQISRGRGQRSSAEPSPKLRNIVRLELAAWTCRMDGGLRRDLRLTASIRQTGVPGPACCRKLPLTTDEKSEQDLRQSALCNSTTQETSLKIRLVAGD